MRYHGEEALGLVETLAIVPVIEAADKMLKAADVETGGAGSRRFHAVYRFCQG